MKFHKKLFGLLIASVCFLQILLGDPGIVWHEPVYAHPDLGGATMRDPIYEAADQDLVIYQGFFKDGGVNGDQSGGNLIYRAVPRTGAPSAWQSVPLVIHADVGTNQYWKATLPSTGIAATDVIEYYIHVTYTGGAPETTYVYGGDLKDAFSTSVTETDATASPFSLRNRPGWILHSNNRNVSGNNIQLRVKTGYSGIADDADSLWSSHGAVYYTVDGTEPEGSLGVAEVTGTTVAVPLTFDGSVGDASGNGNAAWFRGTLQDVLLNLDVGDVVKYRIGLWNDETNEEKFADHVAGTDNLTFSYMNGQVGDPYLTVNAVNANYTTTKLFVDEIASESHDLVIEFKPNQAEVTDVEIYTNLNRRDLADEDGDGDGYPDGISGIDGNLLVAGEDGHYYKTYTMNALGGGTYGLTMPVSKTGAYRLTARWKVESDPNWRWYTNIGANRRDHAITVSPRDARDIVLYEINVLNIEATDDTFDNRSTLEDLHMGGGGNHAANNRWDLDYLKNMGANWLWFQPIHPAGRDGREPSGGWNTATPPYEPGSPYAVKNFFEVNPIMSKNFSGNPTSNGDLLNQSNRDAAMTAWQNFVTAADTKKVGIMLDAPFNHTAFDVELAQIGVDLFQPDGQTWSKTDEIRNREARFFSLQGDYSERASSAFTIAAGPDRFDFGKWRDVKDVYFGRYDALVETDSEPERSSYTSEGDWFDYEDANWTADDFLQGENSKNVTRLVWAYFAEYALYWLEQTGYAEGTPHTEANRHLGIDGLRCDFGQGLPPRAWEYIINVARERKWNFVMMSESLDGGAVTYRSNRHFDILNENIVFPLKSATNKTDYRAIFEGRRDAYGQGLVLINNVSHDEENYQDPWEALIRFSVAATMDGVPMIFPGQELGISTSYGYNHYEQNFGKTIPHFKRHNSMQPIWLDTDFGRDQLYKVYAGMGAARNFSPALRSSNRWFLNGNGNNTQILGVAKYETPGSSPAVSDVVLAFTNLNRDADPSDQFTIPDTLADQLGLVSGRVYNVRNISAYLNEDIGMGGRRDRLLWENALTREQLRDGGFFVKLNRVPTQATTAEAPETMEDPAWNQNPFEAQYLKVYDVTAPGSTPANPEMPRPFNYEVGTSASFDWTPMAADAGGVVPHYEVSVYINNILSSTEVVPDAYYDVSGSYGDEVRIQVKAVNPDAPGNAGPASVASETIRLLDPDEDEDSDGQSNFNEDMSGTNPRDGDSVFQVVNPTVNSSGHVTFNVEVVHGYKYTVKSTTDLTDAGIWADENGGDPVVYTPGVTETEYTFTDLNPGLVPKFYRVLVEPVLVDP